MEDRIRKMEGLEHGLVQKQAHQHWKLKLFPEDVAQLADCVPSTESPGSVDSISYTGRGGWHSGQD